MTYHHISSHNTIYHIISLHIISHDIYHIVSLHILNILWMWYLFKSWYQMNSTSDWEDNSRNKIQTKSEQQKKNMGSGKVPTFPPTTSSKWTGGPLKTCRRQVSGCSCNTISSSRNRRETQSFKHDLADSDHFSSLCLPDKSEKEYAIHVWYLFAYIKKKT